MSLLKKWRKSKGWKQQEAADFLGINIRSLGAYEREEVTPSQGIKTLLAVKTKDAVPADSWE